jgi:hypothetical protein
MVFLIDDLTTWLMDFGRLAQVPGRGGVIYDVHRVEWAVPTMAATRSGKFLTALQPEFRLSCSLPMTTVSSPYLFREPEGRSAG